MLRLLLYLTKPNEFIGVLRAPTCVYVNVLTKYECIDISVGVSKIRFHGDAT